MRPVLPPTYNPPNPGPLRETGPDPWSQNDRILDHDELVQVAFSFAGPSGHLREEHPDLARVRPHHHVGHYPARILDPRGLRRDREPLPWPRGLGIPSRRLRHRPRRHARRHRAPPAQAEKAGRLARRGSVLSPPGFQRRARPARDLSRRRADGGQRDLARHQHGGRGQLHGHPEVLRRGLPQGHAARIHRLPELATLAGPVRPVPHRPGRVVHGSFQVRWPAPGLQSLDRYLRAPHRLAGAHPAPGARHVRRLPLAGQALRRQAQAHRPVRRRREEHPQLHRSAAQDRRRRGERQPAARWYPLVAHLRRQQDSLPRHRQAPAGDGVGRSSPRRTASAKSSCARTRSHPPRIALRPAPG